MVPGRSGKLTYVFVVFGEKRRARRELRSSSCAVSTTETIAHVLDELTDLRGGTWRVLPDSRIFRAYHRLGFQAVQRADYATTEPRNSGVRLQHLVSEEGLRMQSPDYGSAFQKRQPPVKISILFRGKITARQFQV